MEFFDSTGAMTDFVIFFNNGSALTVIAFNFRWDNDDGTLVFEDDDGDEIAVFKIATLYGVSISNKFNPLHTQLALPCYDKEGEK